MLERGLSLNVQHCGPSLPEQLDSLGSKLLAYCDALEEISCPNSLTRIPPAICYGCPALKKVQIGSQVESIGNEAFALCSGLSTFISATTTPPTLGNNPFTSIPLSQATLIVPTGAKATYGSREVWRDFGTIDEREFSSISDLSSTKGCIYRSGDQLILDGTVSGEEYRLYSLEGALLTQGTTLDGCTTVDVKTLPSSHYILVVSQSSYVITL